MVTMLDGVRRVVAASRHKMLDLVADIEEPLIRQMGRDWENAGGYQALARAINQLVQEGLLRPVKAAGENGRRPPLALRYRRLSPSLEDYSWAVQEMLTTYQSGMSLAYFLDHPQEYVPVRQILKSIDSYLVEKAGCPPLVWDTVNERSFWLTGDEKFLASTSGKQLLKRLKLTLEDLHCLPAPEPFFYWSTGLPARDGNVFCLVVENKDTFFSFKTLLAAGKLVTVPAVHFLIYGEGKKILHSWPFIFECVASNIQPTFFYFGDLDPQGVAICAGLMAAVAGGQEGARPFPVLPAEPLYLQLLETGRSRPLTSDQSRVNPQEMQSFFQCCSPDLGERIQRLWEDGLVVPQEALAASILAARGEVCLWPACRR
ncbi:hypothetical protein GFC01_11170 [Desulfofundulus thermobenzoicus]|uniref:Wadjet protein JetD C-terminal domain-containing protein n=1 Tax=Desulfofundulus thermobenzoicus TaxID=29376 RepID=A0A6N7IRY8_9FIRM|nr:hypothetical protein [Desulfofundulus thermobenzoicus]MQL52812.1 hypothetical protein [Desulfofundulus thermobenzoicus]HHW42430.1 hypothetical protein [Desulfotomaculum sp.]